MLGKVYPISTNVNQLAPNQRVNRWPLVSGVSAPFRGDPPAREFGFWFNYFWQEVIHAPGLSTQQQKKAAEAFFSVFEGAHAPFTVRQDFARQQDQFKENVLRQILLIGFKRVALETIPMSGHGSNGRPLAQPPLLADEAKNMNLFTLSGKRGDRIPIAFRADGRSYEDLVNHKGFRTRARSEDSPIHSIYGLNQPWHPFNNPVYRNSLFLRLGSGSADNCLQTVISVGEEFAGITHFPILNDVALVFGAKSLDGQFLARKPLDEWTDQDVTLAATHAQRLRVVRDRTGEIDHLEKDNYIYAFHLGGVKLFNTHKFFTERGDAPFPERAANNIPIENFLVEIHFVQKWFYAPSNGEIKMYEVAFDPIHWLPSPGYVDVIIGAVARKELEDRILSEERKASIRSDFTSQMTKYQEQLRNKANMLTAGERQQVYRALKDYLSAPTAKKVTSAEKAGVKLRLLQNGASTAFLAKLDLIGPGDWNDYRAGARNV